MGAIFSLFGLITIVVGRIGPNPYDHQPYRGSEMDEVAASGRRFEHGIWVVTFLVGLALLVVGLVVAAIDRMAG